MNPYLFHVGRVDESKFTTPARYADNSNGYSCYTLVDRFAGAVHMGVTIGQLKPEGGVERCVNAYEKGIYVTVGRARNAGWIGELSRKAR